MQTLTHSPELLLQLRSNPPQLGKLASQQRIHFFGRDCQLRGREPNLDSESIAIYSRLGKTRSQSHWPIHSQVNIGDAWALCVEANQCQDWLNFLSDIRQHVPQHASFSPFSRSPSATHQLWLVASTRLILPQRFRVEARHDLLGIRIAQIALHFGADTLSGPIDQERSLPLAGISRPVETSKSALLTLIQQAGYHPCSFDATPAERLQP